MKKTIFYTMFILSFTPLSSYAQFRAYLSAGAAIPAKMHFYGEEHGIGTGLDISAGIGYGVMPEVDLFLMFAHSSFSRASEYNKTGGGVNISRYGVDSRFYFFKEGIRPYFQLQLGSMTITQEKGEGIHKFGGGLYFDQEYPEVSNSTTFVAGGFGIDIPAASVGSIFVEANFVPPMKSLDATSYIPVRAGFRFTF